MADSSSRSTDQPRSILSDRTPMEVDTDEIVVKVVVSQSIESNLNQHGARVDIQHHFSKSTKLSEPVYDPSRVEGGICKRRRTYSNSSNAEKHGSSMGSFRHVSSGVSADDTSLQLAGIEQTKHQPKSPIDGGFAWVIVIGAYIVNLMFGNLRLIFALYIMELIDYFDRPLGEITVISSVDIIVFSLMAIPSGSLTKTFGSRAVCMAGLILSSSGILLSSFVTDYYLFIFTFGVLKAIGQGLLLVPSTVIVQQYFDRKRPLAVGLASLGRSCGPMAFAPIQRVLIDTFGWRGGMRVTAAIIMQCLLFAALLRPLWVQRTSAVRDSSEEEDAEDLTLLKKEASKTNLVLDSEEDTEDLTLLNKEASKTNLVSDSEEDTEDLTLFNKEASKTIRVSSAHPVTDDHPDEEKYCEAELSDGEQGKKQTVLNSASTNDKGCKQNALIITSDDEKTKLEVQLNGKCQSLNGSPVTIQSRPSSRSREGNSSRRGFQAVRGFFSSMANSFETSLLREPRFWLFMLARSFAMAAAFTMYNFTVARAVFLGVDNLQASLLITCIGAASLTGRFMAGLVGNMNCTDRQVFYYTMILAGGVLVCLSSAIPGDPVYLLGIVNFLFGLTLGIHETTFHVVASDIFSLEKLPGCLGWSFAMQGIVAFATILLVGVLFDTLQSYTVGFIVAGLMQILGGLCQAALTVIQKRGRRRKRKQHVSDFNLAASMEVISS